MVDDVSGELARGGFRLDAGDELAARRTHHLNSYVREALVERLDDFLLHLGEIRGVVDQLAFVPGGGDQLGRAKILCRGGRRQRVVLRTPSRWPQEL